MHYFAYLFPIITMGVLWVLYPEDFTYADPWLIVLAVACAEAGVGLAHALMRHLGKDTEYLSGYVVMVRRYYEWTERVEYTETRTDSQGKQYTERKVRYVHHPEEFDWVLNTGVVEGIISSTYYQLVRTWNNPTEYFETNHSNCVAGGGGESCEWDMIETTMVTQTYTHRYTNPLDRSNSIFRYEEINKEKAVQLGLYEYPGIKNGMQEPIVGLNIATSSDQRRFQILNARNGMEHQIHIFVLLYPETSDCLITDKQRAYWHGGNKNEFVVCIGTDYEQKNEITKQQNNIKWLRAFSWMDEPRMQVALENHALDLIDKPLDLQELAQWLEDNLHLWKRKQWSDFRYIHNPMVWWQLLILYIVTIAICVGMAMATLR